MGGFTYLTVLAIVTIMGITLAATGEVWHVALKREKERELLFVGDQFRRAINSYYAHTPVSGSSKLNRLEDLLQDPRYPTARRHLRKIYADPISGRPEWGVLKGASGEILGVHSLSEDEPMKKFNFSFADSNFEGKTRYADWVFMHTPGAEPPRQLAAKLKRES
ncbi:MAG: hypothetical protein A3F73_06205 [Gallionellales bacterium RIFCSPLOWO2_12_FULL_59_22]|nr:MAG: hypothetical protein A3H99_02285 [Gallionellales bacterium RIFCSPLOWO2_02_FULL_59_110]OGT01886.1 MAG: hypothetical protein A2Z65_10450 [Gallionellales bacterium RIFCSPLOWO2_02_58_13]OGT10646.1 MAG: hypothetical protein A3F73_06205 [Gallionellales bacterium RIFCSPLOWO2_12_FULL_59_22]